MKVNEQKKGGILTLRVDERALVRAPDWGAFTSLRQPDSLLVAVDLEGVEFISSLFLQGCVELGRDLAANGRHLVLLRLSPHHKRLLELVQGGARMPVLGSRQELEARLLSLRADPAPHCDGEVGRAEKNMLWS